MCWFLPLDGAYFYFPGSPSRAEGTQQTLSKVQGGSGLTLKYFHTFHSGFHIDLGDTGPFSP